MMLSFFRRSFRQFSRGKLTFRETDAWKAADQIEVLLVT